MLGDTNVKYLKGVGEKRAALLSKLGVNTVRELISLYPRAYEDWSSVVSIADAAAGEEVCIRAFAAKDCTAHMIRKGLTLYKTEITDGEYIIAVTFFNNKYAAAKIERGREYLFFGKVTVSGHYRSMNSPEVEPVETGERIRPIYPQTEGINSKWIEKLVSQALEQCLGEITDPLPQKLREEYCLMPLGEALKNIHFPQSRDLLGEARRRLIFEELLLLQLGLVRLKSKNRKATSLILQSDLSSEFRSLLPFELTGAQTRAIAEAVADMRSGTPMNRLLQGDVGSGKTAVAASLIYTAAANGWQSALMAPTEVLAQQHFKTLSSLFEGADISVSLLTGSTPAAEKKKIKAALADGSVNLVIGTHALIQKDVAFANLGLVITDEQHRFGVNQRSALGKKGSHPHTLVMSATPIPRTLALIIYGDLDISVLDELPKGRQKIDTFCVDSSVRERAYGYIKKHLCAGKQGYIVCPLIEQGDMELKAAQEQYKELADGFFKGFGVGLLHGKMKADEKRRVMADFAAGSTQLLISTTVIEVGIDVPNAVIMVIENAERFGLSQLHQLRGRIGRGSDKSTCILISDASGTAERLQILTKCSDGFKIADEDLRLRGPGDFFGSRQHGLPELKIADMMTDGEAIRETRAAAQALLEGNPSLAGDEFAPLRAAVNSLFASISPSGMN